MPAEQKSELAFLPLQADRSERPGVPGLTVVIIVIFVITIMIVMQVQSWEGAAEEEEECSIEGMPCIKVINILLLFSADDGKSLINIIHYSPLTMKRPSTNRSPT